MNEGGKESALMTIDEGAAKVDHKEPGIHLTPGAAPGDLIDEVDRQLMALQNCRAEGGRYGSEHIAGS